MQMSSLKDSFLNFCGQNKFEKNLLQIKILDTLITFLDPKIKFFDFFIKPLFMSF